MVAYWAQWSMVRLARTEKPSFPSPFERESFPTSPRGRRFRRHRKWCHCRSRCSHSEPGSQRGLLNGTQINRTNPGIGTRLRSRARWHNGVVTRDMVRQSDRPVRVAYVVGHAVADGLVVSGGQRDAGAANRSTRMRWRAGSTRRKPWFPCWPSWRSARRTTRSRVLSASSRADLLSSIQ